MIGSSYMIDKAGTPYWTGNLGGSLIFLNAQSMSEKKEVLLFTPQQPGSAFPNSQWMGLAIPTLSVKGVILPTQVGTQHATLVRMGSFVDSSGPKILFDDDFYPTGGSVYIKDFNATKTSDYQEAGSSTLIEYDLTLIRIK